MRGGAIDQGGGSLTLVNTTIANNRATQYTAGLANRVGMASLTNTLLSGNFNLDTAQQQNCYKAPTTSSFSLSSDGTCGFSGDRNNLSLPLGPLANGGGSTLTHLLPAGSPAIDAGNNPSCPAVDQRGYPAPRAPPAMSVRWNTAPARRYSPGFTRRC